MLGSGSPLSSMSFTHFLSSPVHFPLSVHHQKWGRLCDVLTTQSTQHSLTSMLKVFVGLEGEPLFPSQISGRPKQVFLKNLPVFSTIDHFFNSDQFQSSCEWETSPLHDPGTTILRYGHGALVVMLGLGHTWHFPWWPKKFHLARGPSSVCLTSLPHVFWWTLNMLY